ncbi:SHOCT domain-containing protein [Kribbella soli]|uniref:SHOCT domain-containing protein n=1 Tax=Kribbella soli TaxID=1124743 RepID=A0A4R0H9Z0_9ACTN|nr:SHOCT domain-containing protein [Kribbella soli]TCC07795.1 SHOCT domain-containing protein [Kribbella soli]
MPGLLRGLARTAAVAGTASAVHGRIQRRQDAKFAQRDAETAAKRDQAYAEQTAPQDTPQAAPPATPQAAPPASATSDRLEQLKSLGELKQSGVLTDAEFQAQKAKILAG